MGEEEGEKNERKKRGEKEDEGEEKEGRFAFNFAIGTNQKVTTCY